MDTRRRLPVSLLLLLATASMAWAHRYVPDDGTHTDSANALHIADPGLSQVVYHDASADARQLWLSIDAQAGDSLYVQLGVPVIAGLENYRPSVYIVGPGLPAPGDLPIAVPGGSGVLAFPTDNATPQFFDEEFTGTQSWILLEKTLTLPSDGTYYVVAAGPQDSTGKFWLAIGTREAFGLGDILDYADVLSTVREFHGVANEPLTPLPRILLALSRFLRLLTMLLGLFPAV